MSDFRSKKADVLNHWIGFADHFNTSSIEFYDRLKGELADRKVPNLEITPVEFAEGGLLSDKRLYLRMIRERLVFDVCACPFGTGFFFSCRIAEIPLALQPWELIIALLLAYAVISILTKLFGFYTGMFVLFIVILALGYIMRNAVALGLKDFDTALIRTPVIGPIYEIFIRKDTYYRQDARLMYMEVVSTLVKTLAEETTASKGVRLMRQYEQAPLLGDLYNRVPLPQATDVPDLPTQ